VRFIPLVAILMAVGAAAQTPPPAGQKPAPSAPQQPTFRAGATIVPVDVRVFDAKGHPVTDLTREDFVVFEDDVPQEVALFAATALTPAIPDFHNGRGTDPPAPAEEGKPSFTVVHGNGAFPDPFRNLDGTRASSATGTVSTMDPSTSRPIDAPASLSTATRSVGQPPDAIARKSFASIGTSVAQTDQAVEKLYQAIDQLKHQEGEKHIIFAASTPPTFDRVEDVEAIAKAANDARVVIDIAQDGACGGCWGVLDLERLAKLTGGTASLYSSPEKSQSVIVKANAFEYHLGYYPTDTTIDSRYRKINVRVKRPGVDLAYRTGYYARKPALVLDPDTRRRYNAVSRALRSSIPLAGLRVTATATPYERNGERGVAVHITVEPDLALTHDNDLYTDSIDVVVLAANNRDALVGRSWNAMDLSMTEADHHRYLASGLVLDQNVPVTAGASSVKVVIYDPASDRTGSVMIPVKR
jgi:Ca-activated chloride channel family protein